MLSVSLAFLTYEERMHNDRLTYPELYIRGLSKKFVEFVNKIKSTNVVALKFLHV